MNVKKLVLIISIGTVSSSVYSKDSLKQFLKDVSLNSSSSKILELQNKSDLALLEKSNLVFDTTGYFSASAYNGDLPPQSPFSTSEVSEQKYELGISKLWSSGVKSTLSYGVSDVSNSFYSGDPRSYILPRLELSLSTNIIQDLFFDRYGFLEEEIVESRKAINLKDKVDQKNLLVNSLLAFTSILETSDSLKTQRNICLQTKKQANKLENKSKRGTVSKKDYYLSVRELTLCQASLEEIEKNIFEQKKNFYSTYNVKFQNYSNLSLPKILNELKQRQSDFSIGDSSKSVENTDDIKYLDVLVKASKNRQNKLEALTKTNLSLGVTAGASGLDEHLDSANSDLESTKYPYMLVELKIDFPFENREALADAASNMYKTKALEEQRKMALAQKVERFSTLNLTFKNEFSIYKKYLGALALSEKILKEATNDFDNGRLDFYGVSEFNKSLISDQKALSSFRRSLIIKIVEYLDFNNFFDQYL